MNLQHVNVKIFVDGELSVDLEEFIKVFHRWVGQLSMDELLIDVADYRHVPDGPGVMMVGLEADYSLDQADGRNGLVYNRKAELEGSNEDRLCQAFRSAANACSLLETEFASAGLKFSRQEFDLVINDRAFAPNNAETLAAAKPEIEAFLEKLLGHNEFTIEHHSDPRKCFGMSVNVAKPYDLAACLETAS